MKQVPMLDLKLEYEYMKEDIDSAIRKCLEHQKWIFGPEVKELEDTIARYISVKHCIGCSSGTEALVLSLRALTLKLKGQEYFDRTDEIITTSFTFTATGDAILRAGATPTFVDIDPVTYNVDTVKIKEYLDSSRLTPHASRVVGLLPVHLYGQSCQMDKIIEIAKEYNLFVVEDVAQAFGGAWKNRKLSSIGTTGCFSFFPSKNLGGFGDGGMVATNDDEIAELIRMLLKHGGKDKYNVEHIGYNARLDTLQAAVVLAKLRYLDEFNERRRKISEIYNKELAGIVGLMLPITHNPSPNADIYHVYNQYTIRAKDGKRDEMQDYLQEKGVSTMVYYPFPLHKMKVFGEGRSRVVGSLEHAEKAVSEVLSLPVEPLQNEEDITMYVTNCIAEYFEG
jgi:dTDP-4-amino-4,6-dideoxygalactose transaminase